MALLARAAQSTQRRTTLADDERDAELEQKSTPMTLAAAVARSALDGRDTVVTFDDDDDDDANGVNNGEFEVVAAVSACFVFVFFFSNCRVASKILIATWSVVASVKDTVQRRRASLDKRRRCI